jgi:hypothetical protein
MNHFETLLKDMSYNTHYSFLEMGKDDTKLAELAAKFGIKLPANDLAIFKGAYAFVDRTNLNGCSLPTEEVVKALDTLRGKAVDFDHLRKRVVGYFLDAELVDDTIICYGLFFKGNFPEDYEIVQDCMSKGTLGISFEAWGQHQAREDGDYDLIDIEFAGGALLIASDPAFPGAGVLELARKDRAKVLEFAKIMTPPKEYVHEKKKKQTVKKENANYNDYEFDFIIRALSEVPWQEGEEECWREVSMIDFKKNLVEVTYQPSGTVVSVDLTPQSVVKKKGKEVNIDDVQTVQETVASSQTFIEKFQEFDGNFDELEAFVQKEIDYENTSVPEMAQLTVSDRTKLSDTDFAVIKKVKNVKCGKRRKVRMFPLSDQTHVRIALARLEEENVKDTFKQLGISYDKTKQRILNKAKEFKMDELLKKYDQATVEEQSGLFEEVVKEVASLKAKVQELTEAQTTAKVEAEEALTAKDTEIASLKEQISEITTKAETAQAELDRRDEEVKQAAIAERKEALGDFAEGMADEDILDDVKYELATLKKENAELKAKTAEEEPEKAEKVAMTKGSKNKNQKDELFKTQSRVVEKAYGKQ